MATTTVTDAGSVRIITEVIPATDPRAAQLASGSQAPARTSLQTQGFRRAHPKVLGVRYGLTGAQQDWGSAGIVLLDSLWLGGGNVGTGASPSPFPAL